jgi:predicted molibdopterin-dependent oxidoreductase YjgC
MSDKHAGRIKIKVDGETIVAEEGQTVAGALVAAGVWNFGYSPTRHTARGPFCGMGICFECELKVNGKPNVRACISQVEPRMVIQTQVSDSDTHE